MPDKELDDLLKQQLSYVHNHLIQLDYQVNYVDDPLGFYAVKPGTVDIRGDIVQNLIMFQSVWRSSDYSAQNNNKYLTWVNSLNLNSLGVKFCINQVGGLSMKLCYFGGYDSNRFGFFQYVWQRDIEKVWLSEARHYFLD